MDRLRLDRDQMRMRYEMQEFVRQKEADHILKKKEIEMEKRLRTSFEGVISARTTTSRSSTNLESAGGEPTVSQDMSTKMIPRRRKGGRSRSWHKTSQQTPYTEVGRLVRGHHWEPVPLNNTQPPTPMRPPL